jgi:hypothetical protein
VYKSLFLHIDLYCSHRHYLLTQHKKRLYNGLNRIVTVTTTTYTNKCPTYAALYKNKYSDSFIKVQDYLSFLSIDFFAAILYSLADA